MNKNIKIKYLINDINKYQNRMVFEIIILEEKYKIKKILRSRSKENYIFNQNHIKYFFKIYKINYIIKII